MSTSTINMEERKPLIDQYLFERRILLSCTGLVGLGIILWITAISTDHWYMIEGGHGIYVHSSNRYFVSSHSGLWRVCRSMLVNQKQYDEIMAGKFHQPVRTTSTTTTVSPAINPVITANMMAAEAVLNSLDSYNSTRPPPVNVTSVSSPILATNLENATRVLRPKFVLSHPLRLNATTAAKLKPFRRCRYFDMFPTEQGMNIDITMDQTMLHYTRTEVSFAIISLMVMTMGFSFSIYTFFNPRYMFKRLAGGIHFISAATGLVVIQVLISAVDYERLNLLYKHPTGSTDRYGYGIYLAWTVLGINLLAAFFFMLYSKKRKGSRVINEEFGMVDEPTIMGR